MSTVLLLGLAVFLFFWLTVIWSRFVTDVYLNVAQAAIDASRCCMLFDQITEGNWDFSTVCNSCEFDLPFVDFASQPISWWHAIWVWDFNGRQIVMEHSANIMELDWTGVEFSV